MIAQQLVTEEWKSYALAWCNIPTCAGAGSPHKLSVSVGFALLREEEKQDVISAFGFTALDPISEQMGF